jgi:membrane fusion protein, adhesin transport system
MSFKPRWMRGLVFEAAAGQTISSARRMGDINRAANILLFAIALAFAALTAWAALSQIDTVAQASGKVIPSARVQMMQSLEGGIVQAIHVVPGQVVEADALLVSLSPLQAGGDFQTRRQQALALSARIARLQAEANGRAPEFDDALKQNGAEYVSAQRASFETRRIEQLSQMSMLSEQVEQKMKELEELRITVRTAERTLAQAHEERVMLEKLVAEGLESRIELVRIARVISEADGREQGSKVAIDRVQHAIQETRARRDSMQNNFRSQAREELVRSMAELRAIEQGMPALEDRVERTGLKAPVRGVVNRVFVNSLGGVAKPGEPLVELVPADDQLVVEAMLSPRDIGFVQVGQTARVKLTAYDYSIYGALPGKVIQVGADAVANERGEAFYVARIETEARAVESLDRKLPIISGMQAQVDIVTGSKTVLSYLLKPLIAVRENAFRER